MALRFAMSGGNFIFSTGVTTPGVWQSATSVSIVTTAPAGTSSPYAFSGANARLLTPQLGNYTSIVAGFRLYVSTIVAGAGLIGIFDGAGNAQCDLRMNASGQLYFTRNGTTIGTTSANSLIAATWNYIEFKVTLSTTGTGSCEVRVNNIIWNTSTSLTNATTTTNASEVAYTTPNAAGSFYMTDFYWLDTGTGTNVNYLGDVSIIEVFPTGAGTNQSWTANLGPFTLSSVANASGGTTVYNGTITNGTSNTFQGLYFVVTGFSHAADNGTFLCTASNTAALTLNNPSGIAETNTASAAFQSIVQSGIHGSQPDGAAITNVGTRPPGDNVYISSSTTNQISDFSHETLSLTGNVSAVVHLTNARKDDAGTRIIAQWSNSSGTTEQSANVSLGTTYQYWQDIIEKDPHTNASWTVVGFNSATFGVIELT